MYKNSDSYQVVACVYTLYTLYRTQIGLNQGVCLENVFAQGISID